MPIATGTKLGQYEVQDFIGQGAMGLVYRAYHSELERTGAVKVMQAILPDPDTVTRFRHEAQAIARLRHPNIVDVYDFGEFQGTPYMIVEYIAGGSLSTRMGNGPLDRATALRYLRGIAGGLDYAHSHGVVHRDVKPANVLIGSDDTPVLADFGLAKLMHGSSLKSLTGVTTGTPAYMAPEQVTGGQVGPAADRYSLATIAYEMLTGVIPFDGEALMELLYAQVHRYPSPPSSRYADLGPQVDAVIMRGLSKNPSDRWESCAAFVDALAAALNGEAAPRRTAPTMVVAPPTTATRADSGGVAVMDRVAAPPRAVTIALAFPPPQSEVVPPTVGLQAKPSNRHKIAFGAAAALVLLIAMGTCAIFAQATTLSANPSRVAVGGTVRVTATHVPANQNGEIQLWSVVHTYPFHANANGDVSLEITLPDDIEPGDHVIKICWDNSCHKQVALRVVPAPASGTSPSPGQSPNPSPTPTPSAGSTSSPRSTPGSTPGSTPHPTPGQTPRPSPAPSPKPTPTPTPPPNPCPLSSSPASITTSGGSVIVPAVTVRGSSFTPNTSVAVAFYFPSSSGTPEVVKYGSVACDGTFTVSFTPNGLDIGTGKVVATDSGSPARSASKNVNVS